MACLKSAEMYSIKAGKTEYQHQMLHDEIIPPSVVCFPCKAIEYLNHIFLFDPGREWVERNSFFSQVMYLVNIVLLTVSHSRSHQ